MAKGKIYLIPNLLGGEQWSDVLPEMVKENAIALRFLQWKTSSLRGVFFVD